MWASLTLSFAMQWLGGHPQFALINCLTFTAYVFGSLELLVILYWWWWVVSAVRREGFGRVDVPKLSMLFGLTILTIGAIIGVTIQFLDALGVKLPTSPDLIGTHASAL